MRASLDARLRRLEGAGDGAQHGGVVIVPAGTEMADAAVDRLIAEHRERTGWCGAVMVLPDNGRDAAP